MRTRQRDLDATWHVNLLLTSLAWTRRAVTPREIARRPPVTPFPGESTDVAILPHSARRPVALRWAGRRESSPSLSLRPAGHLCLGSPNTPNTQVSGRCRACRWLFVTTA